MRERSFLIDRLPLSLFVNRSSIVQLSPRGSVVLYFTEPMVTLSATNGFHQSVVSQLQYRNAKEFHIRVRPRIADDQLLAGILFTILLFAVGKYSGSLGVQILSFVPPLAFGYLYYFQRHRFIQLSRG